MSNLDQDPFIQNYKVKKIVFEADTFKNYIFKFDDHSIIGKKLFFIYFISCKYYKKMNLYLDTTSIFRIEISRYERNEIHISVPIAVFSPID